MLHNTHNLNLCDWLIRFTRTRKFALKKVVMMKYKLLLIEYLLKDIIYVIFMRMLIAYYHIRSSYNSCFYRKPKLFL